VLVVAWHKSTQRLIRLQNVFYTLNGGVLIWIKLMWKMNILYNLTYTINIKIITYLYPIGINKVPCK
jgi:hypothetical protein